MKKALMKFLPRSLREKAEQFFGLSFTHVKLVLSDLPRLVGAKAFAYGDTLHFPIDIDFSRRDHLALLGHELTHLAQQQSGQVEAIRTHGGVAFNDDPALEAEAWRLGWRFARNQPCDVVFSNRQLNAPAVMQCAVLVNNQMIQGIQDLQPEAATTISLIEGGTAWLNWAAGDMNVRYEFDNPYELTEAIQRGLHGSGLLLLSKLGLWINPIKLMTLEPDDFKAITSFETSSNQRGAAKVREILENNQLYPQAALVGVDGFLDALGVPESEYPVFQALGLDDRLALIGLQNWLDDEDSWSNFEAQQAAAYAVSIGQSPQEFADYFQYYYTLALRQGWFEDENSDQQGFFGKANELLAQMMPVLRTMLRGALHESRPSTQALQKFIIAWQDMGVPLGFQRISAAVNQVTQQTTVGTPDQPVTPVIQQYLKAAQAFIRNHEASAISLSQDGLISRYAYTSVTNHAELHWNNAGVLTLQTFGTQGGQTSAVEQTAAVSKAKGASHGNQKGKSQTTRRKTKTRPATTKSKKTT